MKKTFLASALSLLILCTVGVVMVHAQTGQDSNPLPTGQDSNPTPTGRDSNPSAGTTRVPFKIENPFGGGVDSLFGLLEAIVEKIVMPIGGIAAVLAFIYSGFLYVMAQGNESQIAKAHQALLYTSIGTAVLLGAWTLAKVTCNTIHLLGGPVCPTN